jgi:hypothetical protein
MQVHIRHGDKWREAKETPTLTYFEKAQQLQVLHHLDITSAAVAGLICVCDSF